MTGITKFIPDYQKNIKIKYTISGFSEQTLEGWMFINQLVQLVHQRMYALLKENNVISRYSVRDFFEFLADVQKVKINDEWLIEPIIQEQK